MPPAGIALLVLAPPPLADKLIEVPFASLPVNVDEAPVVCWTIYPGLTENDDPGVTEIVLMYASPPPPEEP